MNEDTIKGEIDWLKENKKVSIVTVGQIMSKDFGPEMWTVDKLIPEQSITAIAGAPGSFKTWLSLDIARCVSSGEDFLGMFKVTKGPVLFVDKENHLRHIQKRFSQIGIGKDYPIYYLNQKEQDFFIDKEEKFTALRMTVKKLGIKVVVFDSLVRIHSGDENDAKSISAVMGKFRDITNLGATVIFIHHHRKEPVNKKKSGNSLRGSSDILAAVDCLLIVEKLQNEPCLTIDQAKLRQGQALEPFAVTIQSNEIDKTMKLVHAGSYDPNKASVDELKTAIPTVLKEKGETGRLDLIEYFDEEYSPNIVTNAIKQLVEEKTIGKNVGPCNKHTFFCISK